MRVTQSMLSNNMLRNLSNSYSKMGTLQNQLDTGKKITRPSQDPVVAMKGIGYRTDLNRVEQYERNLGEASTWLDSSDSSLDSVGSALIRIKELAIDAANGTKTADDRDKIAKEVEQIKMQIRDLGNTKVGDKFIFTGTKTLSKLFDESKAGVAPYDANGFLDETQIAGSGVNEDIKFEISAEVQLKVNINGIGIFKEIDEMLTEFQTKLESGDSNYDSIHIQNDANTELVLTARANIGARQNRVEMMENRLSAKNIIVQKQISDNEDVDYEKTITELITQESIHSAGLAVGSRIIQQTLVDFLR